MVSKRVDWQAIREEFVTGPDSVTLASLATAHGTRREVVSRRASKERWAAQRSRFRHETVTLLRKKQSNAEVDRLSEQLADAAQVRQAARDGLTRLRKPRRVKRGGKMVELPPAIEGEASLAEVRRLFATAAAIEFRALTVEHLVMLRLGAELENGLRIALPKYGDEFYLKLLNLWEPLLDAERLEAEHEKDN